MPTSHNLFPAYYEKHHQVYLEDLPFWESLARWKGDPVLELGSGTGRVLIPLAHAGYHVVGIEQSADMLAFLQMKIPPDIGTRVDLVKADMRSFQLDDQYPLAILPCNTYSTFDPAGRSAVLNCIWEHLGSEGIFAVSMPNPELLLQLDSNSNEEVEITFNHPESGYPVQVSSSWTSTEEVLTFHWHYDHLNPNGQMDRITVSAAHYLAPVEVYLQEMKSAGFTIEATYGDFDPSPYADDSVYFIVLAQKT
jgi:SAM-dependent methyltransferase